MSGSSSRGIFLSYRREDAGPYARLLKSQLSERFPEARVFMDIDSIEAGMDFADVIAEAVDSSAVLVALIGRQWAKLADQEGRRRLDDPNDYVRFELHSALKRNVRVIPVLIDGARPLRQEQLPSELHKLARLNALELSYSRYEYDADRLFDLIRRVLATAPSTAAVDQAPSTVDVAGPPVPHGEEPRPDGNSPREAAQRSSGRARDDGARAARLLTDAEGIANSITNRSSKASALSDVAEAMAATNPDHAERIAHSISYHRSAKVSALSHVAEALVATEPDRAGRLFTEAQRIANSITNDSSRALALSHLARALAATDPDHAGRLLTEAVRIANSISNDSSRGSPVWALSNAGRALAATDPDGAEHIVHSITDEPSKVQMLCPFAAAVAATDPDRADRLFTEAIRIADSINEEFWRRLALSDVAGALAATDPDRAERIARSITDVDEGSKASVLSSVASAVAATDPEHGGRLFTEAVRIANSITDEESLRVLTLSTVAKSLAATDPDRAERIADSFNDWADSYKGEVLRDVARSLAVTDPDRAERIAHSIADEQARASALSNVAKRLAVTSP